MSDRQQEAGSTRYCAGHQRLELVGCYLALGFLAAVLLWPAVRHPGWWIWTPGAEHSDLAVTHWPNAHFTRHALWQNGRFPLWRRTIMSGTPFAANPLAGLYYPPNWLFLFLRWLPLEVGFNISALAHLWLAGAAMYTLMRRGFGTGAWGGLVAAVIYEASPKLLAHLGAGHVGWVEAWGWLPVVMLCWLEAIRRAGSKGQGAGGRKEEAGSKKQGATGAGKFAILAGAALAMQFCADVRMAAYTVIASVWLLAVRCWMQRAECKMQDAEDRMQDTGSWRSRLRRLKKIPWGLEFGIWSLGFIAFLGLSACQWLPLVALLPETTRASMTAHDAAVWSLPWRYLVGLVLANHGGFHEWVTYVGMSTLLLAGMGVRALWRDRTKRWLKVGLIGLLVGAAWFSLGENGGLFLVLWRVVPGLGLLRVPPRAWVLVVFATAALAGLGVEGPYERKSTGRRQHRKQALLLALGAFPAMLLLGYRLTVGTPPLNLLMFGVVTPLMAGLIGFKSQVSGVHVKTILKLETLKPETILGLAAVLLVAVDLLVVDGTLIEARPPEKVFAQGREAAEWLAAQPGHFRVYSPSYSIPQHVAELYGLEPADGVDPVQLRDYADYLTRAAGLEPQGYSVTLPPFQEGSDVHTALKDVVPDTEMLGLLGVRYIAAAFPITDSSLQPVGQFDGVYVYHNEEAQPVASAESGSDIVRSDGVTLFHYRPWPVYAGWAVSGVTVTGLLAGWLLDGWRRRRADG
jgi:hypothetical protein